MSEQNKLVILNETLKKEGSEEEVEGLTIVVDGVIQQMFEIIKRERGYTNYNEVLGDIIFEGVNSIIKK
ncbi:hypothetical protein [Priestia endophytica]|jgi:hypothetical protein|uniref:hypothetical protein n=1 Tax=Priestia endophytica TaxID=135735 RepID=UPI000F540815|nr:hypothetical protein [Priestia endophytica]MED4072314.1 hypothetical protein [Priestia endophytica]RPK08360.1 hypothetical protein FH5_04990 [Priestia endophytica]